MTVATRRSLLAFAVAVPALAALPARASEDPIFSTWGGGAIRGYDPVAYFTEGRPVEGSSDHKLEWKGATWYFSSAANREAFAAAPEKYAPQYGGYCAWAVAQGYTASTDPDAWDIVDGKLYLNYNKSVQAKWQKDRPGHIAKADGNWPSVLD